MLGSGYVIDNYISVFHKEQHDKAYRIYVTDTLRVITENTSKQAGGSYMKIRFAEIFEPPKKEEERTAEEVISDLMDKLRKV